MHDSTARFEKYYSTETHKLCAVIAVIPELNTIISYSIFSIRNVGFTKMSDNKIKFHVHVAHVRLLKSNQTDEKVNKRARVSI